MKKLTTFLLAAVLVMSLGACSLSERTASGNTSVSTEETSSVTETKKEQNRTLSEKEAIQLVEKQVLKDYENEDTTVDKKSAQVLDQNDSAYIIGFDISDTVYGNHLYTEAYWIHKKTREIKDVCSINEYYEGLIDVTNGESNF